MKRDENALERNTAILDALCELFADKPEGVSTIVIARKAGLSLREAARSLKFLQSSDLVDSVSRGFVPSEHGINYYAAKLARG